MLGFKGEAHTVQRVRQREGAHASAFEEHRASSSESCDTLTLWHCDFMTPRPILSLSSSLSPPLSLLLSLSSSLSLPLSDTHTNIFVSNSHLWILHQVLIQKNKTKQKTTKNRSIIFTGQTYRLRHTYTISHVWRCTHTLPSSSHVV